MSPATYRPFAIDDHALSEILQKAEAAIWIYDIDHKRIRWANPSALRIWEAESLQELCTRDLAADMSRSVEVRLAQYQEDFRERGAEFFEAWTLFPRGTPRTLRVKYSGIGFPDGRIGMLCQSMEQETAAPETVRSIEALLHTSVMITMFEAGGEQLYCNPAARATYDSGRQSMKSRFEDQRIADAFNEELMSHGSAEVRTEVNTKAGRRWHHLRGMECRDGVTGKRAIYLTETDVSEEQKAKALLELSRNDALEANRLKSEFLANMSHEIRTPLNGVLGMAQILKRTDLTPEQSHMLDVILASGETLLSLISNVLDISKIEANELVVSPVPTLPMDVIASAVSAVQGAALAKGIAIETTNQLSENETITCDPDLVRQVLVNLAGNALKFSSKGIVRIVMEKADSGGVRFSVTDDGPGIPTEQQALIFDRFRQADGSASRPHGGTGLGLPIAKSLVERMGGEIGLDSVPGAGSTFWFTLPDGETADMADDENAQASDGGETQSPAIAIRPRLEAGRILVVEDNDINREISSAALRFTGYETVSVASGREALSTLKTEVFALILLDLHMPGLTGLDVLKALRGDPRTGHDTPVIIMSADATVEARAASLRAGASEFLTKPIVIEELVRSVARALSARPQEGSAVEQDQF
ncbi:MAG: ATP-binding protein [Pseudomonadota bacterium]